MLHDSALICHPDHDLFEALCLKKKAAVLMAEG